MSVGRGEEKTPSVSRWFFFLLTGLIVLLDQFTKGCVRNSLQPGSSVAVLPNLFHLTLVENQGIAFGLFQGADTLLFVIITISIIVLIVLGLRSHPGRRLTPWGMGLILGGAIGNWIDRVRMGAVIDFLDFRIWPVFNLADTAITVGVGLFLLELVKDRKHVS